MLPCFPWFCIPGVPKNNLAPMKNCPGGGVARLPKLDAGVMGTSLKGAVPYGMENHFYT